MRALRIASCIAGIASALLAMAAPVYAREPAPAPTIELVRVAANTGTAAGGHVALRVGRHVYHHQAGDDGLLRFVRDDWTAFQLQYRTLENRGLQADRLAIDDAAARRLGARLAQRLAVERVALARLAALELETRWFEALGTEHAWLSLAGAGLFERGAAEDEAGGQLRALVQARHGEAFLRSGIAAAEAALRDDALRVSRAAEGRDAADVFPTAETEAERRRARLVLREALTAIEQGWPLHPDASLDPDAALGLKLSGAQREALERQASELERSVLRLLTSSRSDRGEPLLLAVARHRALRRSLALGRLVLLDPTPDHAPVVGSSALAAHRELALQVLPTLRSAYGQARSAALEGGFDELRHHRLETLAAFQAGFEAAANGRGPVRLFTGAASPPSRRGLVPLPAVDLPAARRALAISAAESSKARHAHAYSLFRHNCATELAHDIVAAFPDAEHAAQALGGELDPEAGHLFLPAAFAHSARRTWAVEQTRELPSWRRQQVAGFEGNPLWIALRESNTWTSRAYPGSARDTAFLFFSDGPVLLRPLQGGVNFVYGLAHAGVGLLALPFDRGRLARAGLEGALYSVPELVGINIRKGSYDLPPIVVAAEGP